MIPRIFLDYNKISDIGLSALAKSLESNTTVGYIAIWGMSLVVNLKRYVSHSEIGQRKEIDGIVMINCSTTNTSQLFFGLQGSGSTDRSMYHRLTKSTSDIFISKTGNNHLEAAHVSRD